MRARSLRHALGVSRKEFQRRYLRLDAPPVRVSVCIATHHKPQALKHTLSSLARQHVSGGIEVIVVDDSGGVGCETTRSVCAAAGVHYYAIVREPGYRNPAPARNLAMKLAVGDIIVNQSDDVLCDQPDAIERLSAISPGVVAIATVSNQRVDAKGRRIGERTPMFGTEEGIPIFFLGSSWRSDLYAIGGNDEQFTEPGYEDMFLADCLVRGRGLIPVWLEGVTGTHQHHGRPRLTQRYRRMGKVYSRRCAECERLGVWCASGGSWRYVQGKNWYRGLVDG